MLRSVFLFWALWRFRRSSGTEIDISRLTPLFLKKGKSGTVYQYKATIVYSKHNGRDSCSSMFWFDAPYGIILYAHKDNISFPVACISFTRVKFQAIRIQQIQGPSYGRQESQEFRIAALAEIKWERLLVQTVCEWAKRSKIKSIEMISCKKSRWYSEYRHQQMFVRYDVTARRMGFQELNEEEIYKVSICQLKFSAKAAS